MQIELKITPDTNGYVTLPILRGREKIAPLLVRFAAYAHFAGGYVRYMVSPNVNVIEAGDVDLFPGKKENYDYIIKTLSKYLEKVADSSVAVTFGKKTTGPFAGCPAIQVIKPTNQGALIAEGSLIDVLNGFDFTIVRAGLQNWNEALVDPDFVEDEGNLFLRIKNIHCPISSTLRFIKYSKKGYKTNVLEVLKLFNDWDKRPVEYINALKTGIPKLMSRDDTDKMSDEEKLNLAKLIYID